jgi:transcriptional regulator with XRE-family HTH domain
MGNDITGVGRHLRRLREQAGLSQSEVARRSGLRREVVCALESGRHDPRISTIRRHCDATGARVFIGLPESEHADKPTILTSKAG